MSAPDPLTALGQRVTALTGRDLRRDQLETVSYTHLTLPTKRIV